MQSTRDSAGATGRTTSHSTGAAADWSSFGPALEMGTGKDELESALVDAYRLVAADVLAELWESDLERLCGMRWRRNPSSEMTRAGKRICRIVLGGEQVALRRPRVRSANGRETELPAYATASERDLLDRSAIEDVTAFVTTGAFPHDRSSREPTAAEFIERLANRMSPALATPRGGFEPGLLIASIDFSDQTFLGAVGIESNGKRQLAGLGAGSAASAAAVSAFFESLIDRHDRSTSPDVYFVGEDPLVHAAIHEYFGAASNLQRSPHDMRRRVLGLLPSTLQPSVLDQLLDAYAEPDARTADCAFRVIARTLESDHPEAAKQLLKVLPDTLTLHRLSNSRWCREAC